MKREQKPRVTPTGDPMTILAYVCRGEKRGLYHVAYGKTWQHAAERWHKSEPSAENGFDLSIPF